MNRHVKSKLILLIGFILGVGFIMYPLLTQLYYDYTSNNEIKNFEEAIRDLDTQEKLKDEKLMLAEAYNEALEPNLVWQDPYSEDWRDEGVKEYAKMLEVNEAIGVVNIPKINTTLMIYAGTSDSVLRKGAGHLEGSSLPVGGKNTHSVITAHSGLPEARLFTDLEKLELEDIFSVNTLAGELYYKVDEIKVIEPDDISSMQIIEGEDYVTLLTCTPYMINSHRLLVRGHSIPEPNDLKEIESSNMFLHYLKLYWHFIVLISIVLLVMILIYKREKSIKVKKV